MEMVIGGMPNMHRAQIHAAKTVRAVAYVLLSFKDYQTKHI
jgi:hypothetical protein